MNIIIRHFLVIIGLGVLLAIPACVSRQPGKMVHQAHLAPVLLTPDLLVEHTLTLVSSKQVECYHFGTNGVVLPAYSIVLRRGGIFHHNERAMVCPVYDWKIVDEHTLLMTATPEGEPNTRVSYQFSSFSDALAVTTDGKKFKITLD